MSPVTSRLARRRLALACALAIMVPGAALAGRETYVFVVSRVDLARKDTPAGIEPQVTAQLTRAIDAHPDVDGALPVKAPDPEANPPAFKAYLKKRRQRAFKVNVEITDFERKVVERTGRSNVLQVRVALRLFGETIPDRVMAFTGDGTATAGVEIGKAARAHDERFANDQALEIAVADALKTSIQKLREPPAKQKRKKP